MTDKILYLTLKKKWFDLIESGEKKIEYRELKPYWIKRLVTITGKEVMCTNFIGHPFDFKKFDYIIFTNGYKKDSPKLKVDCKLIGLGEFEGKVCFAIHLGKVKKYDFNVCIKCQKFHKDVPCKEDCMYLKEKTQDSPKENKK